MPRGGLGCPYGRRACTLPSKRPELHGPRITGPEHLPPRYRRRPFFQPYHLIVIQDGDPARTVIVPEG